MTLLSEDELNKGAFRVTGDLNPTLTFEWALEIPDFEHLMGQIGGGYVPVSLRWAGGCSLLLLQMDVGLSHTCEAELWLDFKGDRA